MGVGQMKVKITKRAVESIKPTERDQLLWDTEVLGFGCKLTPRGKRIYILQYWQHGRSRRFTIGRHGDLTADEARREAQALRGLIARGNDPSDARASGRADPTFTDFAARYMKEHAAAKKKASSAAADERNLRNHVLPKLGRRRLNEISRADIANFHAELAFKPGAANRCLALLSKMFNLAENWGLRPDGSNPTRHVEKYPERKLERYLTRSELARLGKVLSDAAQQGEHPSAVAAIQLLLLTGCRRDEILTLRWEYVDRQGRCLRLPDSKTGSKVIPLGEPAMTVLDGLKTADGDPYVLKGTRPGGYFVGLGKAWRRMRMRAGLTDVRLHDLRHSYASAGVDMGESLYLVGSLLGHKDTASTARYAHLSSDPRLAAADRISRNISNLMSGDHEEDPTALE